MNKIKLSISNTTDVDYKKVILRKFFNMVFISEDGKKLSIYTAVVFGGMASGEIDQEGRMIPVYGDNPCKLRFHYSVNDASPDKIEFLDVTKSFWDQEDYIKEVWGQCEHLNEQSDAVQRMNKLYPGKGISTTGSVPDDGFYFFSQNDKGNTHRFVVQIGRFKANKDYFELNTYDAKDGLECLNWINTTLYLKDSILDVNKRIKFEIELGKEENTDSFYTPDFTWYFAPPSGFQVDISKAKVSVGKYKDQMNLVQEVSDDTTVLFKEWEDKERIEERKKARVNFKEYTSECKEQKLSNAHRVEVCLNFLNPKRSGNRQFLMGMLAGFLLAFSADKTRMNDYYRCINQACNCIESSCRCERYCDLLSIVFPIVVLCAYISIILRPNNCLPKKQKRRHVILKIVRITAVIFAVFHAFYIYVLWPVFDANNWIRSCQLNWSIILALCIGSILGNLIYIIYCLGFRKISVYDQI